MRTRVLSGLAVAAAITLTACGSEASTSTQAPATEAPAADTMADDAKSDEMSDDTKSDEMSDDAKSDEMADDTKSDEMADDTMADDTKSDEMSDDTMADDTKSDEMSDDTMADHEGDDMTGPEFTHLSLTDVKGEAFTLSDFMGKPVFVETFATWCPKCQAQLGDTNTAAGEVGDGAVFVAISIEADISPDDVAAYASDNGFDNVRFAVATPEFLAAMTDHYGPSAANAPGTPHFIIGSDGAAGDLLTGSEDSAAIVAAVQAA